MLVTILNTIEKFLHENIVAVIGAFATLAAALITRYGIFIFLFRKENNKYQQLHNTIENEKAELEKTFLNKTEAIKVALNEILPYMADRKEQDEYIRQYIVECIKTKEKEPVFLVISGDELEYPFAYVRRLRQVLLPEIFNKGKDNVDPRMLPTIQWPDSSIKWHDIILPKIYNEISNKDKNYSDFTVEDAVETINNEKNQVIIEINLRTLNVDNNFFQQCRSLLDFISEISNYTIRMNLFIILSIEYKSTKDGYVSDKKIKDKYNKIIFKWLNKINKSYLNNCLSPIVPKLDSIKEKDADRWLDMLLAGYCKDTTLQKIGKCKNALQSVYKKSQIVQKVPVVPMLYLSELFETIYKICMCKKGAI
jgi:hypothetical protein